MQPVPQRDNPGFEFARKLYVSFLIRGVAHEVMTNSRSIMYSRFYRSVYVSTIKDRTVKLVVHRESKLGTDSRGRSVWVAPIEDVDIELMSSQELELAIRASRDSGLDTIKEIEEGAREGVVVRDCATGALDVITDADLQNLMERDQALNERLRVLETVEMSTTGDDVDRLSLLSTQALRTMLSPESPESEVPEDLEDNGFDPYDRG